MMSNSIINVKNKSTLTITLLIILLAITAYYYSSTQSDNPTNNQTDDDSSIKIAVTYEKLAENVGLFPHPVPEGKITALVAIAENEINQ